MKTKFVAWVVAGFGVAILTAGRIMLGKDLPKQVPLWYSRPWGEAQLAKPEELVVIPVIMVGLAIITGVLSEKTKKNRQWQQICEWSGVIAEIILGVALFRIWMLVI